VAGHREGLRLRHMRGCRFRREYILSGQSMGIATVMVHRPAGYNRVRPMLLFAQGKLGRSSSPLRNRSDLVALHYMDPDLLFEVARV